MELEYLYDIRIFGIFVGILIPAVLYWFSKRNHDYWKKRGVPYAKPSPFIGSFGDLLNKNAEDVEVERYKKLGRIYGFFEGSRAAITVGEPEMIKNILVKDFQHFTNRRVLNSGEPIIDKMMSVLEGEDWKRVRTIVSPTFSTGKIKRVLSIFQDCSKTILQNFKGIASKGNPVEVVRLYGAFSMDVIASSAFSTKIDSHNNPENQFVKTARMIFNRRFSFKFLLFLVMPKIAKKIKLSIFPKEVTSFFKNVTLEIIKERKKTGQTRNDFLQLLMDTADEVSKEEKNEEKSDDITSNYGDDSTNHAVFKGSISKNLSMDELIAQCVIFFLAGYHTTATTLSLATYLLTINQDAQDRLFKEIKDVLKETNGELTYESVQKMKYLDNVISETVRIYAPAGRLERTANTDYKLADTGITIPKGMVVGIPIYAMHRDYRLFPEPEKFIPDRFTAEGKEKQIPYSYLPFGAGPRNCVGMRFALMELKVCLIHVFSTFHVQRCPETEVPVEFGQGQGLLTPKSVKVHMEPRNDCPLKS